MKLRRHYFISDNLDDLEAFEEELEASGVVKPQIHVFSLNDTEIAQHEHLNYVQSFLKKDVVHSTKLGALIGICVAALSLFTAHRLGWTESGAGWIPFIFLAIALFVFCTWEGGLIGIETPNYNFTRFAEALENDKHLFFIDLRPSQEAILNEALKSHPQVKAAGTGSANPSWLVVLEDRIPRFFKHTFP
jgi:hypothetical protein